MIEGNLRFEKYIECHKNHIYGLEIIDFSDESDLSSNLYMVTISDDKTIKATNLLTGKIESDISCDSYLSALLHIPSCQKFFVANHNGKLLVYGYHFDSKMKKIRLKLEQDVLFAERENFFEFLARRPNTFELFTSCVRGNMRGEVKRISFEEGFSGKNITIKSVYKFQEGVRCGHFMNENVLYLGGGDNKLGKGCSLKKINLVKHEIFSVEEKLKENRRQIRSVYSHALFSSKPQNNNNVQLVFVSNSHKILFILREDELVKQIRLKEAFSRMESLGPRSLIVGGRSSGIFQLDYRKFEKLDFKITKINKVKKSTSYRPIFAIRCHKNRIYCSTTKKIRIYKAKIVMGDRKIIKNKNNDIINTAESSQTSVVSSMESTVEEEEEEEEEKKQHDYNISSTTASSSSTSDINTKDLNDLTKKMMMGIEEDDDEDDGEEDDDEEEVGKEDPYYDDLHEEEIKLRRKRDEQIEILKEKNKSLEQKYQSLKMKKMGKSEGLESSKKKRDEKVEGEEEEEEEEEKSFQKGRYERLKLKYEQSKQLHFQTLKELGDLRLKLFRLNDGELRMGTTPKILGTGGFGTVYECEWNIKRIVAVKEVRLTNMDVDNVQGVIREFQTQVGLVHPNVLRVYGYSEPSKDIIRIVMEKMDMNLFQYVTQMKPLMGKKIELFRMMIQSLRFLHSQTPVLLHRDIKSFNFLVSKDGSELKISDFGMLKTKQNSTTFVESKNKGTARWMAPEILGENRYSVYSDVYALGITFWEVMYGKIPFVEIVDNFVLMFGVFKNDLRPKITEDCPKEIKSLLEKMWNKEPRNRPTTEELLDWIQKNEVDLKKKYGKLKFPIKIV